MAERPFDLTPYLARLRSVLERRLGLLVDGTREKEIADAVRRRTTARGCDFFAYLTLLEEEAEVRALGELLSIGETYFFRTPEHFAALLDVAPKRSPLRLLSVGCSSGEEPYSLAIALSDAQRGYAIDALDISSSSLAKARAGIYSAWSLRETPAEIRTRWFVARGRDWVLRQEARESVRFFQHNLVLPLAAEEPYDVVFCRNVLIYFTPEAASGLVARLARILAPDGVLFISPSETLRGLSTAFTVETDGACFFHRHQKAPPIMAKPVSNPTRVARIEPIVENPPTLAAVYALIGTERFGDALELLSKVPVVPTLLRAVLLLHTNDIGSAEALARPLTTAESGDDTTAAEAHVLLALAAEHRGDERAALEEHRAASYLDANLALAHLHQGRLLRKAGQLDAAKRALGQALELLEHEPAPRILLFGGGFTRDGLRALCRSELGRIQ